jgi:hypothetical protein
MVFLIIWVILLWSGRERMLRDPGTYWHIAAGEKMLSNGEVLRTDPFSYSMQGQTWIAQQWLAECIMALLLRLAGLDLLLLTAVTIIAAMFAMLAERLIRCGCTPLAMSLLIALILGGSSFHFLVRPHLATFAMMGLLQMILMDVESGRCAPHRLLLAPLMLILWTNLHGGALGGAMVIGAVLSIWLVAPYVPGLRRYVSEPGTTPLLGVVLAASVLAVIVNPYGPRLPSAWIGLMQSSVLPQVIIEHAPLRLASFEGLSILTTAALYAYLLGLAFRDEFRVAWLVPMFWFFMALARVRHGPLFAISAGFCIADMLPFARPGIIVRTLPRQFMHRAQEAILRPWLAPACVCALAAILQMTAIHVPLIGAGWARVPADVGSLPALAALQHEIHTTSNARVFNEMRYGGLAILRVPEARCYIDDRCELYGDQGLERYVALVRDPSLFRGLADYDHLSLALISRGSRLDRHLAIQPDWQCAYSDAIATVYRRR